MIKIILLASECLLRADFAACDTYTYVPEEPLAIPITAYGGLFDAGISREQVEGWRRHTTASFSLRVLPGDHFFINTSQTTLLRLLLEDLTPFTRDPARFDFDSRIRIVEQNSQVGILRLKRDVGKENSLGLIATTYNFVDNHNHLGGFDGRFRLDPQTVFTFQAVGTRPPIFLRPRRRTELLSNRQWFRLFSGPLANYAQPHLCTFQRRAHQ